MPCPILKAAKEPPDLDKFEILIVGLDVVVVFVTENELELTKSQVDSHVKHEDIFSQGVRDITA